MLRFSPVRLALCPIFKLGRPIGARTVGAAEDFSTLLDPMPYNSAPASGTLWRQRMDRAFQAVEDVTLVTYQDFEGLVVVISANFTTCHFDPFFRNKSTGVHLMDVKPLSGGCERASQSPNAGIHG
jgi:hypothetical protein